MNDPTKQGIDVEAERNWLMEHRAATGASWADLAKRIDIAQGTISQFGSERGYAGDEEKLAEKVFRYRQTLAAQAQLAVEAPEMPGYFETPTSKQLGQLLNWAQRGRIVVGALGPGTGKTMTAKHFRACYSNVFMSTMTPSTRGVNNMQVEVLEAMGERDAVGPSQKLSRRIRERVRDMKNPLLILDEAQHLSEQAIEEIRSWNDAEGLGIALLGNEGVMQRLEGGTRKIAFAQLYSRVSMRLVRPLPLKGDADAMAAAWGIERPDLVARIRDYVMKPGGLRGASMTLELAFMLAAAERKSLDLAHLQDAWAQLSTRAIAA